MPIDHPSDYPSDYMTDNAIDLPIDFSTDSITDSTEHIIDKTYYPTIPNIQIYFIHFLIDYPTDYSTDNPTDHGTAPKIIYFVDDAIAYSATDYLAACINNSADHTID